MSWPIDEDGAPITYVAQGRVWESRAEWKSSNVWQGREYGARMTTGVHDIELTEENLGLVWARGWGTREAEALRVAVAL